MSETPKVTMRTQFPDRLINKLPKGTKAQNDCPANEKVNCKVCGGWHHPKIIHLDYVGHAALTDRLLDVDESWNWEPLALKDGLPAFDESGGLWIRLTVNGVSRLGYGNAAPSAYKDIGAREKEVIGDALRNAAMRFGAALELWFKGELHPEENEPKINKTTGEVKGSIHKPTKDLSFKPDADKETFLLSVVDSIVAAKSDIDTATALFYGQNLDNDQMVWIWDKLGKESALRSAMKKHHQSNEGK